MSDSVMLHFFCALLMGTLIGAMVYLGNSRTAEGAVIARCRYDPLIDPLQLLTVLLTLVILSALFGWITFLHESTLLLRSLVGIAVEITVYYTFLLLLLPLLRRLFRAGTVAALWLLPNILFFTLYNYMRPLRPRLVVPLPLALGRYLLILWLLGFAVVMGRATVGHFQYRRALLQGAEPVTDPAVLALWEQEKQSIGGRFDPPLLTSDAAVTPLSVGVWKKTVRVVLPRRTYTPEELTLIFRHELIHVRRRDGGTKLFLTLCQALCWFNPLMWVAMRKCADDLELGCDELALDEADGDTRKRYAHLLLETAGDERGFTSCLSARAQAMAYRLRGVMAARRRLAGGLLVGLLTAALLLGNGAVALAYAPQKGGEVIFSPENRDFSLFNVYTVPKNDPYHNIFYRWEDSRAVTDYIAGLTLYRITELYADDAPDALHLTFTQGQAPNTQYLYLTLREDHLLHVRTSGVRTVESGVYYFPEDLDTAYLQTLLTVEQAP